jgi:hypothetical protein
VGIMAVRSSKVKAGEKHGRWTVLGPEFSVPSDRGRRDVLLVCECDCGVVRVVMRQSLLSRRSSSCECRKWEVRTKHGHTSGGRPTRLYRVWRAMLSRVLLKEHRSWKRYGGRGISVHPEWLDFVAFAKWATENGYSDRLQIDREDNDGNYEPSNCRFVTPKVNCKNKCNNVTIIAFGEAKILEEWGRDPRCVVHTVTLQARLAKGIPPEVAMKTPSRKSKCER